MKSYSDSEMEQIFAPVRDLAAPSDLAAKTLPERPKPTVWFRPALAGGAVVVVAIVGAVSLLPGKALAQQVLSQAQKQFTGRATTYKIGEDGTRTLIIESWFAPGKTRLESRGRRETSVSISNGAEGFQVNWHPYRGQLTWGGGASQMKNVLPSNLTPEDLAILVRELKLTVNPKVENVRFDGKEAKLVKLESSARTFSLYAEPKTLKLLAYEYSGPGPRGVRQRLLTKLEAGLPPDRLFQPIIQYKGQPLNVRDARESVQRKLEKPLATYKVAEGSVSVRAVRMNGKGDLFVLFTGLNGKHGYNVVPTKVTDDAGGVYVRGIGFRPYEARRDKGWSGYTFDGKPLEGAWYTRIGQTSPKRITIGFERDMYPKRGFLFTHSQRIRVEREELFDFMLFMAMCPNTPRDLEISRTHALAGYYQRTQRWSQAEALLRRNIAMTEPMLKGRAMHGTAFVHYQLADVLARQGKKGAARTELAEARRRLDLRNEEHLAAEIAKLERSLGG